MHVGVIWRNAFVNMAYGRFITLHKPSPSLFRREKHVPSLFFLSVYTDV